MNSKSSGHPLRNLSVAYHYGINRLLALHKYFSNHYACSLLGRLKFRYFMHFRMLRFCIYVVNTNSPCFVKYRRYFVSSSHFYRFISEIFLIKYGVRNILDNEVTGKLHPPWRVPHKAIPSCGHFPPERYNTDGHFKLFIKKFAL